MAIRLDGKYLLLVERDVRWLERSYDGWDMETQRPVTVGWFPAGEGHPILPVTTRLQHPNIISLLDVRRDEDGGVWAVWDHFGPAGADTLEEMAASSHAVTWVAHEATQALLYARGALARPGGFRIGDFGADQIRLFEDGSVRVVGFGRIAAERDDARELGQLGEWLTGWLVHSGEAEAASVEPDSVAAEVVSSATLYADADQRPQAVAPRIIAGLRAGLEGGDSELGDWVRALSSPWSGAATDERQRALLSEDKPDIEECLTFDALPGAEETDGAALPRVRIAPMERPAGEPQPERTSKGLPTQTVRRLPLILTAAAILLIVFGTWQFRGTSDYVGNETGHQVVLRTMPAGASVFLDDTMLIGTTPMHMDDVPSGWHQVRFATADFPTIEDSILVYKQGPHRAFEFVFTRTLRIESLPPGAIVYLNGRRALRPTPFFETHWPVTDPLALVMHLEGYGSIEDCEIDPVYGTLEVRDPAAWSVEPRGDTLVVRGMFVHSVAFFASPSDCRIHVDDTLIVDPSGGASYVLTFGPHRLRAQAVGFESLDTTLVISGQTPSILPVVLSRPVRIFSFDPRDPETDLRALVDRLEGPERTMYVRRFTPYSVRIPAVAHTVTLRKRNYLDTTVYIPPDQVLVTVAMRPTDGGRIPEVLPEDRPESTVPTIPAGPTPTTGGGSWLQVQVEAPGRGSLAGAEIWARSLGVIEETLLGTTDDRGQLRVRLPAGNYDLLAYLDAYSGVRKRVKVRPARNRPVVIELRR